MQGGVIRADSISGVCICCMISGGVEHLGFAFDPTERAMLLGILH